MAVVLGQIIGDARFPGVHVGAAELLGADHFAGCRLYQRRPAEKDGALVAHDDGLVRHRRHIGAACGAGAHHHRDLRDAGGRHGRLIVEDAAEMLAVGEHFGLMRQVGAAGIDQINAGQAVLARDLLGAQMLLHRHRIIGAALDRGIVADDDAFAPGDAADAGDDARGMDGVAHTCRTRRAATVRETARRDRSASSRGRAADSLPRPRWRSRARGGPPSAAVARRSSSSAISARIAA